MATSWRPAGAGLRREPKPILGFVFAIKRPAAASRPSVWHRTDHVTDFRVGWCKWSCLMTRLRRAGSGRLTKSGPRVARACTVAWQKPPEPCARSRTPTPRVSAVPQLLCLRAPTLRLRLQLAPRIVTERQSARQQRWLLGKTKAARQFSLSRPSWACTRWSVCKCAGVLTDAGNVRC